MGLPSSCRTLASARGFLAAIAMLALSPCALSQPHADRVPERDPTPDVQARIARVEQGLSTPVVVKGAPDRRMRLMDRMADRKSVV